MSPWYIWNTEIMLNVALNTKNKIIQIIHLFFFVIYFMF